MSDIDNELRQYAIKRAEGRATEGDNQRLLAIGEALSKERAVPPAPAPNPAVVEAAPAPLPAKPAVSKAKVAAPKKGKK